MVDQDQVTAIELWFHTIAFYGDDAQAVGIQASAGDPFLVKCVVACCFLIACRCAVTCGDLNILARNGNVIATNALVH